ncbi:hypothetical protein C5O22_09405 [Treponema sp. J25]|nr:hypothetical protein C5O22_09405 [Treponema sp. J25]
MGPPLEWGDAFYRSQSTILFLLRGAPLQGEGVSLSLGHQKRFSPPQGAFPETPDVEKGSSNSTL